MLTKFKRTRAGFSLIELLITMAIIAILIGVGVPAMMVAYRRAQQFRIENEVSQIDQAMESFKNKYGFYPPHTPCPNNADEFLPYLNRISPNHSELQIVTGTTRRIDLWWTSVGQYLNPETSLAFWLSGISKNKQYPLTYTDTSSNIQPLHAYNFTPTDVLAGYSVEREVFIDFTRLFKWRTGAGSPIEGIGNTTTAPAYPYVAVVSQSDRYEPYVYFSVSTLPNPLPAAATTDLLTATNVPTWIVYLSAGQVTLSPYWTFDNSISQNVYLAKNRFQIVSPGMDGILSNTVICSGNITFVGANRLERDNLSNFSNGRLENLTQ